MRALPAPSVSTPVSWDELQEALDGRGIEALQFGPDDVLGRLEADGDLMAPVLTVKQELPGIG
jgi:bifunctional non-homologous end joining protein LigD